MKIMINVAVIYIFRGADLNNVEYLNDFQKSMKKYRAGIEFQLIVAIKGCSIEQELLVKKTLNFLGPIYFYCIDHNFDIGTYQEIVEEYKYENFIMMNSSSRPLADNWILEMLNSINNQSVGLVGTMGSLESLALSKLHGIVSNKDNFDLFPNPHIRTTGMIIKRDIFNIVTKNRKIFRSKMDAYDFESGKNNLTKEILGLGFEVLVINSEFKLFEINDWKNSRTFRQFNQEKLLIKDKVSISFEKMSDNLKFIKTIQTWGDEILENPGSIESLKVQDYRKITRSSANYG
jgi:hypothetical protein